MSIDNFVEMPTRGPGLGSKIIRFLAPGLEGNSDKYIYGQAKEAIKENPDLDIAEVYGSLKELYKDELPAYTSLGLPISPVKTYGGLLTVTRWLETIDKWSFLVEPMLPGVGEITESGLKIVLKNVMDQIFGHEYTKGLGIAEGASALIPSIPGTPIGGDLIDFMNLYLPRLEKAIRDRAVERIKTPGYEVITSRPDKTIDAYVR